LTGGGIIAVPMVFVATADGWAVESNAMPRSPQPLTASTNSIGTSSDHRSKGAIWLSRVIAVVFSQKQITPS
jgi:hypothetical protein